MRVRSRTFLNTVWAFTRMLVVSAGLLAPASAVLAEGDQQLGGELARQSCARCHNVEAGGAFKLHPPSFAAIAVYRSREQIYGRIVFPPLHSGMPEIGYLLTPDNVDHVVAYITSLEVRQ